MRGRCDTLTPALRLGFKAVTVNLGGGLRGRWLEGGRGLWLWDQREGQELPNPAEAGKAPREGRGGGKGEVGWVIPLP